MLVPLDLPPGIFRAGTEYQSRGRWYDASLVRFTTNTIQPVGGWVRVLSTPVTGRVGSMFAWRPNSVAIGRFLAIGTNSNAYAYDGTTNEDITPVGFTSGLSDAVDGLGYGAGAYGAGTYGTIRTVAGQVVEVATWHFDAWGEYLVGCCSSDGKLYEWQLVSGTNLTAITNAPTQCRGLVVTAERMLMAFAPGGDLRKIQWSNQEANTNWTAGASSTAGDLLITTDGRIITGERVRGGVLIHTDTDAHLVSYVGAPFYYGVDRVGDNCGIISVGAKVATGSFATWMGNNAFFIFDGYTKPLPCTVQDYVFSDINLTQKSKVTAGHNGQFGEIWWFYPSSSSTENDRYVIWNYRENHWNIGTLSRTAWADKGVWKYAQASDASGYFYEHENGWTDNGAERTSSVYLTTGPNEIVPGERLVWLNQVLFDESGNTDRVTFTLYTKFAPEGTEYTAGPYTMDASEGYADVRAQGRTFKVKFVESTSGQWKLGSLRFDVKLTSKR